MVRSNRGRDTGRDTSVLISEREKARQRENEREIYVEKERERDSERAGRQQEGTMAAGLTAQSCLDALLGK